MVTTGVTRLRSEIIVCPVPLCSGDVVSFKDVKQRVFVVQFELQLLSRPVFLLSQEETQQWLTLQRRNVLQERNKYSIPKGKQASQSLEKKQQMNQCVVPRWQHRCTGLCS